MLDKFDSRTKATLIISGADVVPERWALYFAQKPDEWALKDEVVAGYHHPLGRKKISEENFVAYVFADPATLSIDEQVAGLSHMLKLPRADFQSRLLAERAVARLVIDVDDWDGDNPAVYGQVTLDFLASTGAQLDLIVSDPEIAAAERKNASAPSGDHQRTKASLTIRGDHVDPEAWALYFGMRPRSFARKNEFGITPVNKVTSMPSRHGHVGYAFEGDKSPSIDTQVAGLRAMLGFPRPDFLARMTQEGSRAEVWVHVENCGGTNPLDYGDVTRAFLAETDADMFLDVYDENAPAGAVTRVPRGS